MYSSERKKAEGLSNLKIRADSEIQPDVHFMETNRFLTPLIFADVFLCMSFI